MKIFLAICLSGFFSMISLAGALPCHWIPCACGHECYHCIDESLSTEGAFRSREEQGWRKTIEDFAAKHLQHSAWGVGHSKRDYLVSISIAQVEKLSVDEEVLFAASRLHDMGGFEEFKKPGVDHAVRSAELVPAILKDAGFPPEKIEAVKGVILAHTYYNPKPPVTNEETVFRDADVLDFMGTIGVARLFSMTTREGFPSLLGGVVGTVETLVESLPPKLILTESKKIGVSRLQETRDFLSSLKQESSAGEAL